MGTDDREKTKEELLEELQRLRGLLDEKEKEETKRRYAEEVFGLFVDGTFAVTGDEFMLSLVSRLASVLKFRYAFVGEVAGTAGDRVSTLAVWAGEDFADNFEYDLTGTPCQGVVNKSFCYYPSNVQALFHEDHLLKEMGVESYMGVPLFDATGDVLGILVAMNDKPVSDASIAKSVIKKFSIRAGAELEHMRSERKIRNYQKRLESIINSSSDMILLKNKNGRYMISNEAHRKFVDKKPEDIIGKTDFDFMPLDASEQCKRSDEDAMRSEMPIEREEYALGRWVHVVKSRIVDAESNIEGVVAVIRDITERKKLEEELLRSQKLESLGVFAGGIAHDFNNLLTGILGNIYLAKLSMSPGDKVFEILTESEKASLLAKDLTRQLVTFAKGGVPVRKITSIGRSIKDWCVFALRGSSVRHECFVADDLWQIEAEKGQIHQVINNLLINAHQAMPDGGIIRLWAENITVSAKDILPLGEGRYVRIVIKDTGTGIPEKDLKKIFDPYFSTKENGRGLGLAASYSIIKKHDGYICVESEVGVGTTCTVYIPASDKEIRIEEDEEEVVVFAGEGKILVMDDEEMIRDFTSKALRWLGYDAELAGDGAEAIELYKKARESGEPFNAVIMDLTIQGGLGGKEAVGELLHMDPEARVIVSSGYSSDPVMANYGEYGFMGVLVKPYTPKKLGEVLNSVIEKGSGSSTSGSVGGCIK